MLSYKHTSFYLFLVFLAVGIIKFNFRENYHRVGPLHADTACTDVAQCSDGNICTTESCVDGFCQYVYNTDSCDDTNPCTTGEACSGGTCTGGSAVTCDDSNGCTDDSCNPSIGCVNTAAHNGEGCDDASVCTTDDICSNGTCTGNAVTCSDGNVCTDDSCNSMTGCAYVNNSASCEDGNLCTTADYCSGGSCVAGPDTSCDDSNACTTDSCSPVVGCLHDNNAIECDDLDYCTTLDSCSGGTCAGFHTAGCCNVDGDCSEGYACSEHSCVTVCGDSLIKGGETCDDGNTSANDGCSSLCAVESGWTCNGGPSVCQKCGDGIKEGTEACDDGNISDGDGCSGVCTLESGYTCQTTVDPTTCTKNDAGGGAATRYQNMQEWGLIPSDTGGDTGSPATDASDAVESPIPWTPVTGVPSSSVPSAEPQSGVPAQGGGKTFVNTGDSSLQQSRESNLVPSAAAIPVPTVPASALVPILTKLSPSVSSPDSARLILRLKNSSESNQLTRASAVRLLLQSSGIPIQPGPIRFLDVPLKSQDRDAIATAARLGILQGDQLQNGRSRGTVRPNDPITWDELSLIVDRLKNTGMVK